MLAAAGGGLWVLFADHIARATAEEVGTDLVGARVDIGRLHIDLGDGAVTLRGLTIASPYEPYRNLLEAEELVADLDVLPLLEKKVVIDRAVATGLRFGTTRSRPGFDPARPPAGRAGRVQRDVREWTKRFDVPILQLATGRLEVGPLDANRLATPAAAHTLTARADSSRHAWADALRGLDIAATVESVTATLERLRGARPTDLRLLNDGRRTLDRLRQTRDRVAGLERGLAGGVAALQAGLTGLAEARRGDYALARGLVRLPLLEAPEIGRALFAPVAIARFEQAVYWARLAREYMPPGLRPHAVGGPRRARAAGSTVRFPRAQDYPAFLLKHAEVADRSRTYTGRLTGMTSAPALYGRPTTFEATAPAVRVSALLDHVGSTPRDTAAAVLTGVTLPAVALPSLPWRLEPGRGRLTLSFALEGDQIRARWGLRADAVRWSRDSGAAEAGSALQDVVGRVLAGVHELELSAELGGTLERPRLSVRSNLDRLVAERVRAVLGEEVAAAERRIRAEVDRAADAATAPARAQVAAATTEATAALAAQRDRLAEAHRRLEQRLRELTRVRLP